MGVCDQRITAELLTFPLEKQIILTMARLACLLLGIGLASAGVIFPVPDPYRWDESFTVEMPQIDDEHRGLFNGILLIERENNEANLKAATVKYHDHFIFEEGLFKQTMSDEYIADHLGKHADFLKRFDAWTSPVPEAELTWAKNWLVQHIKNTDFKYIDLLPHHVPKPYNWDDSLEVFYARLDDEHKQLFDHLREVGHTPESTKHLSDLKFKMRAHFDYERGFFCNSETYHDCEEHSKKHDTFYKRLFSWKVPVAAEDVEWAKNWLVQHIKNTDFGYKFKLNNYKHKVPRPYVWQPYLQVYYQRLDEEHVVLFDAIRESVEDPASQEKYDHLYKVMVEHFEYEQGEFSKIPNFEEYSQDHINKHTNFLAKLKAATLPLDCDFINYVEDWLGQHIMNTDFSYRGKLIHEVPEPYVWEPSFQTFYERIDKEHVKLFDCIRESSENPSDEAVIAHCKTLLRVHFDYEESEFCKVPDYDCYGHYLKHYNFQTKFQEAHIPLTSEVTDWAKNWLAQHIKNTDFAYRGKLFLRRHYVVPDPYVWDKSFLVNIKELDDEHVVLFDAVREVEAHREDQAVWDHMIHVFNEHFRNEEGMFSRIPDNTHNIADHRNRHFGIMNTVKGAVAPISEEITEFVKNWLAQHIKNTDFDYKGKMPEIYPIPEPFQWNRFFAVFYEDMDNEHKPLFTCIADLQTTPEDSDLLASCLKAYEDHFVHEQKLFMASNTYSDADKYQHINKHNAFLAAMRGLSTPVSQEFLVFAKNWLTQHIPNTDFRYKGKMPFHVADPYVWDESFQVYHTRLDDEHVLLFDLMQQLGEHPEDEDLLNKNRDIYRDHFDYEEKQFMACGEPCDADAHKKKHDIFFKTLLDVEHHPDDQEKVEELQKLMRDHFYYEEGEFCDSIDLPWDYCKEHKKKHVMFSEKFAKMSAPVDVSYIKFAQDWLAQHIKNTDFGYRGHLKHDVPEPYVWDESFATEYTRLDEEHDVLFAQILAVSQAPDSAEKLATMKDSMRKHFDYEQQRFCSVPSYNCVDHKMKHYKFWVILDDLQVPIDCEKINWAKNWLAQHIKNTDHGYKHRLIGPDSGENFSGPLP